MKRNTLALSAMALASLLASHSLAITATKEYVDRRDAAILAAVATNADNIATIGADMAYKGRHPLKSRCQFIVAQSPHDELIGKVLDYYDDYYPANVWATTWMASILPRIFATINLSVGSEDVSLLRYIYGNNIRDTFYSDQHSLLCEEFPPDGLYYWSGTNSVGESITLIVTNRFKVVYGDLLASASNALAQAIADAQPADYATVSNRAMSAVQTESDPTVPSWAKASSKPSYTAAEVGALPSNVNNVYASAGLITEYLLNSALNGGIRINYSSTDGHAKSTYYGYNGVTARRQGVGDETYLFDTASTNGVVRRKELAAYKPKQTAKSSPSVSGNALNFITTVSQDEDGVITAAKSAVRNATTSQTGIVQLNDATNSTSTAQAATANAVRLVRAEAGKNAESIAVLQTNSPAFYRTGETWFSDTWVNFQYLDVRNDIWLYNGAGFCSVQALSNDYVPLVKLGGGDDPSLSIGGRLRNSQPHFVFMRHGSPNVMSHLCPDGSDVMTSNMTAQAIAASVPVWSAVTNAATITCNYGCEVVNIASGATLTADTTGWKDGEQAFVVLKPQGAYTVAGGLELAGYGDWPTTATQCIAWKYLDKVYVTPIRSAE